MTTPLSRHRAAVVPNSPNCPSPQPREFCRTQHRAAFFADRYFSATTHNEAILKRLIVFALGLAAKCTDDDAREADIELL
jgi:hypothetical protein